MGPVLTVLFGLSGAVVYGFADFLGGLASRRIRPVTVAAVAAAIGIAPLLIGLAVLGGSPSWTSTLWGAVAGLSGAVGVLLLYAALAIGPMSVLSPLTAVFAAVVPVVVAVARGTVLSPLAIAAVVVAVVAVVLVAAVRDTSGARPTVRGVVAAVVAGCGFGGIVLAYDMTPPGAGIHPLVVARVLQTVLLGAAALVVTVRAGRTARSGGAADPAASVGGAGSAVPPGRWWPPRLLLTVAACGVFDALANVCIQAGLHASDDPGTLPVVSVLNALYPIGTVVLAGVVLRERLTAPQWVGIVLAFVASVGLTLA
jgi:drug/metabolite transporter (DMT)-like permease